MKYLQNQEMIVSSWKCTLESRSCTCTSNRSLLYQCKCDLLLSLGWEGFCIKTGLCSCLLTLCESQGLVFYRLLNVAGKNTGRHQKHKLRSVLAHIWHISQHLHLRATSLRPRYGLWQLKAMLMPILNCVHGPVKICGCIKLCSTSECF